VAHSRNSSGSNSSAKAVQRIVVVMANNGEWRACARGGIIPDGFRFGTP
jgi:hypothetical protein